MKTTTVFILSFALTAFCVILSQHGIRARLGEQSFLDQLFEERKLKKGLGHRKICCRGEEVGYDYEQSCCPFTDLKGRLIYGNQCKNPNGKQCGRRGGSGGGGYDGGYNDGSYDEYLDDYDHYDPIGSGNDDFSGYPQSDMIEYGFDQIGSGVSIPMSDLVGAGASTMQTFLSTSRNYGYQKCGSYVDSRKMDSRIVTKNAIAQSCRRNRCTAAEHALLVALVFQETTELCGSDLKKGRDQPRSNYSPYNMNMDFLNRIGCDSDCARSLGQYCGSQNVNKATFYMLKAIRGNTFGGICGVVNFHRGGSTTFNNCKRQGQCNCKESGSRTEQMRAAIAKMTVDVMKNQMYKSDSTRLCMKTPHWRL